MSHSTTSHRRQILLGVTLTAVLALGASFLASGAPRGLTPTRGVPATPAGRLTDCPAVGLLVAAAVTATSPGAGTGPVGAALARARGLAKGTASDDVREAVQNLADDLAAYRVTLTTTSDSTPERRADTAGGVHGDVTALRHLCGL